MMSEFQADREEIKQLKQERGYAKKSITRRYGIIRELMKDVNNSSVVESKLTGLNEAVQDFMNIHNSYHELLMDEAELEQSHEYYSAITQELKKFKQDLALWSVQAARNRTEELLTTKQSVKDNTSVVSKGSSITSAKAKVAAKKAVLLAEAAALKDRQALEKEELQLQQRKRELDVNIEIAKAEAEEQAYSDHEQSKVLSEHDFEINNRDDRVPTICSKKLEFIEAWRNDAARHNPISKDDTRHNHVPTSTVVNTGLDATLQPRYQQDADYTPLQVTNDENYANIYSPLNPNANDWQAQQLYGRITENDSLLSQRSHLTDSDMLQLIHSSQKQQQQLLDTIHLPKTELMTFDGNPLQYWVFMRSFENSVDKVSVDDNAKLTRLLQYCTGKARKIIQCCAAIEPSQGYIKAKNLLKERFGNEYLIAEAWIQKVTEGSCLKPNDREALQTFSDELINCSETLLAMQKLSEIDNQRSLVTIIQKLPMYLQNRWKREAHRISKTHGRVHITDVVNFIRDAAEEANNPIFGSLTEVHKDKSHSTTNRNNSQKKIVTDKNRNLSSFNVQCDEKKSGVASSDVSVKSARLCPLCKSEHKLFGCDEFKSLSPEERLKFVYQNKLCLNCLQAGHLAHRCLRESTCSVPGCGRKHTRFLHQSKARFDSIVGKENSVNNSSPVKPDSSTLVTKSSNNGATCSRTGAEECSLSGRIVLPIVAVKVYKSSGGNFVETLALLDSGSTNTFCSEELITQLGVPGQREQLSLTTLEKSNSTTDVTVVSLVVSDMHDHNFIEMPKVFSRQLLPFGSYTVPEEHTKWPHLSGLEFPQVDNNKVQLLIGQDIPDALLPLEVRKGAKGEPYATRTQLGWALNGPLSMIDNHKAVNNFIQVDHRLEKQVEAFWKLEASELLADSTKSPSISDLQAVSIWDKSITTENGHYQMDIPFRTQPPEMPNNKSVAVRRLQLLQKRLQKDSALSEKYCAGIQDLLDNGYAEKIPDEQVDKKNGVVWYLPHHPVFNDKKPEKLRIVFDCAAKYQGLSLNNQVLMGPDLMNNLIGVLFRFREEPIALMSDIQAMFHQVKVSPEHCDALRFLWWPQNDPSMEPEEYRMTVHLFGGVWSPSCSNYALLRTAKDNAEDFETETTRSVRRNFYMDDFLKSVSTEEQGIHLSHEMYSLLQRAGFRLTKWVCNNRTVLNSIPEEERAVDIKALDLKNDMLPCERALGLQWNVEKDRLGFKIYVNDKPLTKRGVLSTVCSLYDPLGLVGPFVLSAKLILQELCRKKVGWDEDLPERELIQWLKWLYDLPKMQHVYVDRCVKPGTFTNILRCELHHFADASQSGYGAVSYIRFVDEAGKIHCSLIFSKCKLSPIKSVTIPRLELSAAALAVKLDAMIRREVDLPVHDSVFWSDSTLVLQYIENTEKRFQTFVANRIAAIRDGSSPEQWHYVDSDNNPADDASRSLTTDEMLKKTRWLQGPEFLWQDENSWPQRPVVQHSMSELEVKRESRTYSVASQESQSAMERLFSYHSSWYSLKKCVAWLLKLKNRLLDKIRNVPNEPESYCRLTVEDLKTAEIEIVKCVQMKHFQEEMKILQDSEDSTQSKWLKKSSYLRRLEPMMTTTGVLCVGGRLKYAPIPTEAKHQLILPKNDHIVDLIVRYYHGMSGHSGREHVLSLIRQKFWIVQGRSAVSKVLSECFDCRRRMASPGVQKMSDLPVDRITPDAPPFTYVGVDYFGPYLVSRGV